MFKTMFFLHRRIGTTVEEFQRYRKEVHVPMVARVPGLERYVINHAVANPAGNAGACDAVAELWFGSAELSSRRSYPRKASRFSLIRRTTSISSTLTCSSWTKRRLSELRATNASRWTIFASCARGSRMDRYSAARHLTRAKLGVRRLSSRSQSPQGHQGAWLHATNSNSN